MDHQQFVDRYDARQIQVHVHRNSAAHFLSQDHLIPRKYRLQQASLRALAFGLLLLGGGLFFFVAWYLALVVVFAGFALFPVCQKHAARSVLRAALANELTFKAATEAGVLVTESGQFSPNLDSYL